MILEYLKSKHPKIICGAQYLIENIVSTSFPKLINGHYNIEKINEDVPEFDLLLNDLGRDQHFLKEFSLKNDLKEGILILYFIDSDIDLIDFVIPSISLGSITILHFILKVTNIFIESKKYFKSETFFLKIMLNATEDMRMKSVILGAYNNHICNKIPIFQRTIRKT